MQLSKIQKDLVNELLSHDTSESVIQYILQMLDTQTKVEQMKNYLLENYNKKLTQNQIILKTNQLQHES